MAKPDWTALVALSEADRQRALEQFYWLRPVLEEGVPLLSTEFRKFVALWGRLRPVCGPDGEVVVHDLDHLVERALIGKRIPAVAVVE
jgi:hypothetical protein